MQLGWTLPLLLLYMVFLGILLWVAAKRKKWYARAKGRQSSLFIVVACVAYFTGPQQDLWAFCVLAVGLGLCAAGDILLGIANKAGKVRAKPFAAGAVTFSLAHIVFCGLFFSMAPFYFADVLLPLLLTVVLFVLEKQGRVQLKRMRAMVYFYSVVVGIMAARAVAVCIFAGIPAAGGLLTAGGGILFLVSDAILLFLYFGKRRSFALRVSNLAAYYMCTFLLALSAHWY